MSNEDLNITVRFKGETASRIRAHVDRMQKAGPKAVDIGVTDAIRNLVERGLVDGERAR